MRLLRLIFSVTVLAVAIALVASIVVAGVLLRNHAETLPDHREAIDGYRPPLTSHLFAADGSLMAALAVEKRIPVMFLDLPPRLVQAFVAAEDQNFFRHSGVDPTAIVRALVHNAKASDRRAQGGSTITQQVAKNLITGNERTLSRKIREALLAFRIERDFPKERILEVYLTDIYFGDGAYGVVAAAESYFGKKLGELTLAEMSTLAALPKAPSHFSPRRNPEASASRRRYVLDRMVEEGYVSTEEAREAVREHVALVSARDTSGRGLPNHFAEDVRRMLVAELGGDVVFGGGLRVRTTLDPRMQSHAETAVRNGLFSYSTRQGWGGPVARIDTSDWLAQLLSVPVPPGSAPWMLASVLSVRSAEARVGLPDGREVVLPFSSMTWARHRRPDGRLAPSPKGVEDVLSVGDVVLVSVEGAVAHLRQMPGAEAALVALDPRNGRVLAMVGGFSFEKSEFNRAVQARRQTGSSFKTFIYLAALENGYDPSTPILEAPIALDTGVGGQRWRPENYSGRSGGPIALSEALIKSSNLATARLLFDLGVEPVAKLAESLGVFHGPMPRNYAAALGSSETSLLRMVAAYAALLADGRRVEPKFVEEIGGLSVPVPEIFVQGGPAGQPVVRKENVQKIRSILEQVTRRGTAAAALSRIPSAGKTGTTNDYRDAWFVGDAGGLAIGVWVGLDNNEPLGDDETGGKVAAPIFGEFVKSTGITDATIIKRN
jgi:penicillin-binding protein 1A